MADASVRFNVTGTGEAEAKIQKVGAAISKVGKEAERQEKAAAQLAAATATRRSKALGIVAGMPALGQIGEAFSAPTKGLVALGIGAAAAAIALKAAAGVIARSQEVLESRIKGGITSRERIAGAVAGANQNAEAFVLGNRERLAGGDSGSKALRAALREADKIQRQIDEAQVARFVASGPSGLRQQLGEIKSPEAAEMTKIYKEAALQSEIQLKIFNSMSIWQKLSDQLSNAASFNGRGWNSRYIDAMRQVTDIQPPASNP